MGEGKNAKEAETIVATDGWSTVRTIAVGQRVESSPESFSATIAVSNASLATASLATAADPTALSTDDRYAPLRELGRGGMGRVDVIFDRALGRSVARKTALEGKSASLLIAEAQICGQLEHPSIVPLYDLGRDEHGNVHYTMRVVNGRTLRDVLDDNEVKGRPHLGLSQLLGVLRQVCLAVDYAHSRGVIHRDLKPENIIVGRFGEVYVLDWGVAYVQDGSDIVRGTSAPASLSIAGSPGYMAPEQAMGGTIDARTDVFALGVILHEMLAGGRPFDDSSLSGLIERTSKRSFPPPSTLVPDRAPPRFFDELVRACLFHDPERRPASARALADSIDSFLDSERARAEREREASTYVQEGDAARRRAEELHGRADELDEGAQTELLRLKPWEPADAKRQAWDKLDEARRLRAEGARALAKAEVEYARALGRIADHSDARSGLAALHYTQFLQAEKCNQAEGMAQHLDLARTYDDGALRLELSDEGELTVETSRPAHIRIARYELEGILSTPRACHSSDAPVSSLKLPSGSYLVIATTSAGEVRYPVLVRRAEAQRLRIRIPEQGELPDDFVLVPGGPFLAWPPRARSAQTIELLDFAIARFPVTFREYTAFLDDLGQGERTVRMPVDHSTGAPIERIEAGKWALSARMLEGTARERVPPSRELDLPVNCVTWFQALAYTTWRGARDRRPYRLPTDLEWEKSMRGADGRAYPMGNQLDPSFAKLRESRPEAAQCEPVGTFEMDESPYGVRDLAGGVLDWTSTSVDGRPLPPLEDEPRAEAGDRQAYFRGGNWGMLATSAMVRASMRLTAWTTGVGFRLALSLDGAGSSSLEIEPMRR
ncbi:MAG: SUMF1/EgtB/PvdO family nonheme iron enzyme [Polyangiaceae bacterium]|nr:SUMF1/EgtB/PvdO family nonheme iron enzyme [Polyangiaceae bacterium]